MKVILILTLYSLFIFGCNSEKDDVQLCESRCEEETTTEILNDVQGKVVINNTYINDAGETVAVYAITTNPDDLDKDTWELFSGFVLAPCNLPESYKKENLGVVISGRKRSCCNQLTQPNFKSAYGCKFEITKIRVR